MSSRVKIMRQLLTFTSVFIVVDVRALLDTFVIGEVKRNPRAAKQQQFFAIPTMFLSVKSHKKCIQQVLY
jgi:hypothetical protein